MKRDMSLGSGEEGECEDGICGKVRGVGKERWMSI